MTISFAFCSYMSYNLYIRLMTIFYHFSHKIAIFANQFLLYFMPPIPQTGMESFLYQLFAFARNPYFRYTGDCEP